MAYGPLVLPMIRCVFCFFCVIVLGKGDILLNRFLKTCCGTHKKHLGEMRKLSVLFS